MKKVILSLALMSTVIPALGMESMQLSPDKVEAFQAVRELFAIAEQIKRDAKTQDGFKLQGSPITSYPDSESHQTAQGTALIFKGDNDLSVITQWGLFDLISLSIHCKDLPANASYAFSKFLTQARVAYMYTDGHKSARLFKGDSPIASKDLDQLHGTDAFIRSGHVGANSVYAITEINGTPQPETKILSEKQLRDNKTIVAEWEALVKLHNDKIATFKAAQAIVATINRLAVSAKTLDASTAVCEFDSLPHFAMNSTKQGIVLTTSHRVPHTLCMPWGEIRLTCVAPSDKAWALLELQKSAKLRVMPRKDEIENQIEQAHGNVRYAVEEVDGIELPEAEFVRHDVDPNPLVAEWNKLINQ